ncbi:MAG TPA: hypothetical protein VG755_37245 [Nannocystaceae bacterium]|nr:hypothetical protein [Nannocystaceae bacterium]
MTRRLALFLLLAGCGSADPKGAAGAIGVPPLSGSKPVQPIVAPNMVGSPDRIVAPNMVGAPDIVPRFQPAPRPVPPGPR